MEWHEQKFLPGIFIVPVPLKIWQNPQSKPKNHGKVGNDSFQCSKNDSVKKEKIPRAISDKINCFFKP